VTAWRGGLAKAAGTALLATALLLAGVARAQNGRGYVELGGGYKTGDFGTAVRTDLYYGTLALGYLSERYQASVTIPYLHLSERNGGASESGIGDVILRGGRVLVPDSGAGFSLDGALAVKFPTADENRGLGTGETDYGVFVGAHQRAGSLKFSLSAGYIKVGDPPGVDYNDIVLYGLGVSKLYGTRGVYAAVEGRRAMVAGAKDPRELSVGYFEALSARSALRTQAFVGLNNGGPDFGVGAWWVRWTD